MSNDIEESNLKIFSTILLDSENNSLILPFNYHKLFDMDIIWFDEFGNMNFNKDLYDNFEFLGIKEVKITKEISNSIKYKKYINMRNEFRNNKFNDLDKWIDKISSFL